MEGGGLFLSDHSISPAAECADSRFIALYVGRLGDPATQRSCGLYGCYAFPIIAAF
jgi:hypothetical protein